MKRALFTSTSGAGHLLPMLPVARAALDAGWEVVLAAPPEVEATVSARNIPFFGLDNEVPGDDPRRAELMKRMREVPDDEKGPLILRENFGRLNTMGTLQSMKKLNATFNADVVVSDMMECSGPIVAKLNGLPLVRVFPSMKPPKFLDESMATGVAELCAAEGLMSSIDDQLHESSGVSYWPRSIEPERIPSDATLRIQDPRHERGSGAREEDLVYISLGTEAAAMMPNFSELMQGLIDGVAQAGLRGVVSLGPHGRAEDLNIPDGFTAEKWLDAGAALRRSGATICHGGAGSIIGALATNTPMIVMPLFADQPANAECLVQNKAALVINPGPDLATRTTAALDELRREPLPRASELSDEIARHAPPSAAAGLLDRLT